MDRSLYIAMSGAKQTLLAQAANSNNLANANTAGFKADFEQFRAMPVFGAGLPTRVYAMAERPAADMSMGSLQVTGNSLDIAVKEGGWLAVLDAQGEEAYTRAGNLHITANGQLQTASGAAVLGQSGAIFIPPAEKVAIGGDGTISIVPLGDRNATLAVVNQIKLVRPNEAHSLEKRSDGLMHTKGGQPLDVDVNMGLTSGVLEGSNVNAVSALVDMIELARNFELQIKVMKTADENSGVSAKLMQMA